MIDGINVYENRSLPPSHMKLVYDRDRLIRIEVGEFDESFKEWIVDALERISMGCELTGTIRTIEKVIENQDCLWH